MVSLEIGKPLLKTGLMYAHRSVELYDEVAWVYVHQSVDELVLLGQEQEKDRHDTGSQSPSHHFEDRGISRVLKQRLDQKAYS